jgi:hypothetical protein
VPGFEDAASALRRVADRRVIGKTVLLTWHYDGRLQPAASAAPIRSNA